MNKKKNVGRLTLDLLSERKDKYHKNATPEECINDLRRVQQKSPDKFITRIKYRNMGRYSDRTWNRFFGSFLEFRKQAGLELTRGQQKMEREIAKHASHDVYRDFFKSEVMPYHNKYVKSDRKKHPLRLIAIASDIHDIECDEFALSVFVDQCRVRQPDVIALNGDIFDLPEFSRFDKDPRTMKSKQRYMFVHNKVFRPLREACPDAQIDFIMGNHEFRLIKHLADRSPYLRIWLSEIMDIGFKDLFGLDQYEINWHSKLDLACYTKGDIKEQLKKNYKVYHDCYVIAHHPEFFGLSGTNGHHHSLEWRSYTTIPAKQFTWVQTPGLHRLDAEYIGNLNKWNLGFNFATINTLHKTVIQEPIHVHEDWAMASGIFYSRKGK